MKSAGWNSLRRLMVGAVLLTLAGCRASSGFVFNNSGKAYYQKGNYAMARDEFRRAADDDPRNADYRHNLALAMLKTGDTAGAERVLRQNLSEVNAMHQPSYHTLSRLLTEQNRPAEAQELLQAWNETQPYVPESHVEMAWIQRELGNPAGAEQSLRQALQLNPRHPNALAHLGQLYEDSGQTDRAVAMYQRSLASRWGQPQVQSRLLTMADGPNRSRPASRSALMQNRLTARPGLYASQSAMPLAAQPMMAPATAQVVGPDAAAMAAAPVLGPTPDPVISSQPQPVISGAESMAFEPPVLAVPTAAQNADPAHATPQMTAELKEVDAY